MKKVINFLIFMGVFVFITSILYLLILNPMKDMVDFCESHNWDGTEYISPVKEITLHGPEYIVVKCNKAEETDAIVGIVNGMYFKFSKSSEVQK